MFKGPFTLVQTFTLSAGIHMCIDVYWYAASQCILTCTFIPTFWNIKNVYGIAEMPNLCWPDVFPVHWDTLLCTGKCYHVLPCIILKESGACCTFFPLQTSAYHRNAPVWAAPIHIPYFLQVLALKEMCEWTSNVSLSYSTFCNRG